MQNNKNDAGRETIGFIGLGAMGLPMAHNLLKAGFTVTGYDTGPARMTAHRDHGGAISENPADVARRSEIIITCLPSGKVVDTVVNGGDDLPEGTGESIVEGCRPGQVLVDMTTNYPKDSASLAKMLAGRGVDMLDAPISGGDTGAVEGTLSIMVGGSREVFERCLPAFNAMGSQVTLLGDAVGAGGHAKLANQIMVYVNLASVMEALTYAAKAGVDVEKLIPALEAGHASSVLLNIKGRKALARDFSPVGPIWMAQKDLTYVGRAMEEMGFQLPFASQVQAMMTELARRGREGEDQAALIELFEEMAQSNDHPLLPKWPAQGTP